MLDLFNKLRIGWRLRFSDGRKHDKEFQYWWRCWKSEKTLTNRHYVRYYTEYFGLAREFYEHKKVLDIGCGPRGSLEWVPQTTIAVGVDDLANRYTQFGISSHRMVYIQSGAESIPVPSQSFDVVAAFNSLDHVADVDACIREIRRVLRPGGLFLFIVEINHRPTVQEPHTLSASVVDRFEFEVLDLRTYRQIGNAGCYETIANEAHRAADDGVSDMWLVAKMRKPAPPVGRPA